MLGETAKTLAFMAKFKALEPIQKAVTAEEYDKALLMLDKADTSDPYVKLSCT